MQEIGLYISLLPAGKVKRHLSSDLGEMPLPDTTIAEELISLTEYDSTAVMDEIRKIETLSHEVAEDIMSQQTFQLRYTEFLLYLRDKEPMWYTLLRAQLREEVCKTSYAEWDARQLACFMVDNLYQSRGAEITVNIALSSLCEDDPEAPWELNVREDIIHQSTATAFLH